MKKKNPYKEINDANYIIDMMRDYTFYLCIELKVGFL